MWPCQLQSQVMIKLWERCNFFQILHYQRHVLKTSTHLAQSKLALLIFGHAIVSHQWVGESEQLAAVRWVGQSLRVAHHARLKHWERKTHKSARIQDSMALYSAGLFSQLVTKLNPQSSGGRTEHLQYSFIPFQMQMHLVLVVSN